jgi:hypothetical protein
MARRSAGSEDPGVRPSGKTRRTAALAISLTDC